MSRLFQFEGHSSHINLDNVGEVWTSKGVRMGKVKISKHCIENFFRARIGLPKKKPSREYEYLYWYKKSRVHCIICGSHERYEFESNAMAEREMARMLLALNGLTNTTPPSE